MAARDTEFYLRCITKCRAVPESERSANVRALLESHELIEAALADVPPVAGSGPPPSFDAVSVALARTLRAAVLCDGLVPHPVVWTRWLLDLLAPVHVEVPGTGMARVGAPVAPFPPAGHERALPALGALLSGIFAGSKLHEFSPLYHRLLDRCLSVLDTAEEAVDAALAQLAASAGGSGPRLPTTHELRIACLASTVMLMAPGKCEHVTPDEYSQATERLLELEPERPIAIMRAGEIHAVGRRLGLALPLMLRAHEAARSQRNDVVAALSGFPIVLNVSTWRECAMEEVPVEGGYPRPSELLAILHETDAASARCQRLPTVWSWMPAGMRPIATRLKEPLQLMVELQGDSLCAPPGAAGAAIEERVSAALAALSQAGSAVRPAAAAEAFAESKQHKCSGCTKASTMLRKCAGCKQAQYCRCARCPLTHPLACVAVQRQAHPPTSPPHTPAAVSARSSTGPSTRRRARQPSSAAAERVPLPRSVRGARRVAGAWWRPSRCPPPSSPE